MVALWLKFKKQIGNRCDESEAQKKSFLEPYLDQVHQQNAICQMLRWPIQEKKMFETKTI